MAVIGTVLLYILWALLALLALVVALVLLVLLIPAQAKISWGAAGLQLWVGALGIRLQLLPQKQKPAKNKKTKPAPQPAKQKAPVQKNTPASQPAALQPNEPPAGQKPQSAQPQDAPQRPVKQKPAAPQKAPVDVKNLLQSLPRLVDMAGGFMGRVLRSLRLHHLVVVVPVTGSRPDVTARRVGKANAWFYAIAAALENTLRLRWQQVDIFPDYDGARKDELLLQVTVSARLLPLAIAALWLLASLKREKII